MAKKATGQKGRNVLDVARVLEDLASQHRGAVSVAELRQFMADEHLTIDKMIELFSQNRVAIPARPKSDERIPELRGGSKEITSGADTFKKQKLTRADIKEIVEEEAALGVPKKATRSVIFQTKEDLKKLVKPGSDSRSIRANAKPFGGMERAQARNSWAARLDEMGFANYTPSGIKPEGGSRPVPVPASYSKEIFATILEKKFGSDDGIPRVKKFQSWLDNIKKFMGRPPTAFEAFAAINAGDQWRNVLPKKSTFTSPDAPPSEPRKMTAKPRRAPKPGSIAGSAQYASEPRQIPAPKAPKGPGVVAPRFPDFEFKGMNANVGGTVNDLPDLPKGGKVPGYKKPGLPIPREQLPKPAGVMSKVEEVARAVSDSADNVAKAVKNSKNVKKALTFAEEILAKRSKMK